MFTRKVETEKENDFKHSCFKLFITFNSDFIS